MGTLDLSRRALVASGLAGVVAAAAGCSGLSGDAGGSGGNGGRRLRLSLDRLDGPLRDRFVVDLSETRPDWDEEAFDAALAGEAYTTQYRNPFLSTADDPRYARRDGTYYRLGSVVVDEATETRPVLRLYEAEAESAADPVAAVDLPEADRRAVEIAHQAARARGNEGGAPWGVVQRGGYVYRRDDAVEASRLLSEEGPDYVTYRDTIHRVETARERFHEPVYRATVEPVAETPEGMEAILRAKFVRARLSGESLSSAARDVLAEAEMEGYAEDHPYSDGFEAVLRAIQERAYIDGNVRKDAGTDDRGRELLLYDGTYYDYRLTLTGDEGA